MTAPLSNSGAPTWQAGRRVDAGRMSLVFTWQGDRFAHVISLDGQAVLSSVEGLPEEPWPASPPAQSLHLDQNPAGLSRAMLVGMAGAGHWSASVEVLEPGPGLLLDLACRLRGPQGELRSSYQVAAGWMVQQAAESSQIRLENPVSSAVLELEMRGCRLTASDPLTLSVADQPSAAKSARTLRWSYELKVSAFRSA